MNEDKLNIIEQQLVELERQKKELLTEKKILLNSSAGSIATTQKLKDTLSRSKSKIIMSLFKGRTDVFANRWKNTQGRRTSRTHALMSSVAA